MDLKNVHKRQHRVRMTMDRIERKRQMAKTDYSITTESREYLENPFLVNTSLNETVCIVERYLDGAQNIRQWSPSKLPKSFQVSATGKAMKQK